MQATSENLSRFWRPALLAFAVVIVWILKLVFARFGKFFRRFCDGFVISCPFEWKGIRWGETCFGATAKEVPANVL